MNIAIDIDGVIFDSLSGFLNLVWYEFDVKISKENVTNFHLEEMFGLSSGEVFDLYSRSLELYNPPIIDNAVDTINSLVREGHNIYLVTSRGPHQKKITYECLKKNRLLFKPDNVIFTNHDYRKSRLVEPLELDVVVDDNISEYVSCIEDKVNIIIYSQPWNSTYNLSGKIIVIKSWDEIYEYIGKKECGLIG